GRVWITAASRIPCLPEGVRSEPAVPQSRLTIRALRRVRLPLRDEPQGLSRGSLGGAHLEDWPVGSVISPGRPEAEPTRRRPAARGRRRGARCRGDVGEKRGEIGALVLSCRASTERGARPPPTRAVEPALRPVNVRRHTAAGPLLQLERRRSVETLGAA